MDDAVAANRRGLSTSCCSSDTLAHAHHFHDYGTTGLSSRPTHWGRKYGVRKIGSGWWEAEVEDRQALGMERPISTFCIGCPIQRTFPLPSGTRSFRILNLGPGLSWTSLDWPSQSQFPTSTSCRDVVEMRP